MCLVGLTLLFLLPGLPDQCSSHVTQGAEALMVLTSSPRRALGGEQLLSICFTSSNDLEIFYHHVRIIVIWVKGLDYFLHFSSVADRLQRLGGGSETHLTSRIYHLSHQTASLTAGNWHQRLKSHLHAASTHQSFMAPPHRSEFTRKYETARRQPSRAASTTPVLSCSDERQS